MSHLLNIPLVKASHMAKLKFERWKSRFYLLMGGEAASLEKDMYSGGRGIIAASFAIYYSHIGKNIKHQKSFIQYHETVLL